MNSYHGLSPRHCPKCGGSNVYLDGDEYGWFEHCLQCGYTRELENMHAGAVKSSIKKTQNNVLHQTGPN